MKMKDAYFDEINRMVDEWDGNYPCDEMDKEKEELDELLILDNDDDLPF